MTLFTHIKSKLSILEVILDYIQLKQAGNYWKGRCPFHDEKDASFTVSPDKGIFYCFGCHAGGDVIAFIAQVENMSQIESVMHLAERYKVEIPKELHEGGSSKSVAEKKGFYHLCEEVALWCHDNLKNNATARQYVNSRNIDPEIIEYYQVGYFPGGMASINKFIKAMSYKNILLKDLIEAGIIIKGNRVHYSPFEERIMFPIRDPLGQACGFGGRIYKQNDERAKYYNSKESPYFHKGKILFGLDLAKKPMRDIEYAFLVEGYTDCVAMAQHGHKNVVATLGTACTVDHLKLLSRYINTLYVLYDGDAAGQKAILRLVELCWGASLELKIVRLPSSDDPDTFLKGGGDLSALVDRADDIFSFFVDVVGASFAKKPLSEKLKLSGSIIEIIARIDDPFKQGLLLQRASTVLQVPHQTLKDSLGSHQSKFRPEVEQKESPRGDNESEKSTTLEKKILFAIINNISEGEQFFVDEDLKAYFAQNMQEILSRLEDVVSDNEPNDRFNVFFESLSEDKKQWVSLNCLKFGGDITVAQLQDLLMQFRKGKWRDIVADIKFKMLKAQKSKDFDKLKALTKQFLELKGEMKVKGLI